MMPRYCAGSIYLIKVPGKIFLLSRKEEKIIMKSKLLKMYDYKQTKLPEEAYIEAESIREEEKKEMSHMLAKYKKTIRPDVIEKGDIAIIDIEGGLPKYNRKKLGINVGRNLYSGEIEEALVGKSVGTEFDAEADGVKVRICVKDVTRRVLPELTEEIVAGIMEETEDEHPEISTVSQFLDWIHKKTVKRLGDDIWVRYTDDLMTEIIDKSEWSYDDEEIEREFEAYLADMRKDLAHERPGMTLETMPADDYRMFDESVSNFSEFEVWLRKMIKQEIQLHLIYCGLKGIEDTSTGFEDMEGDAWGTLVDYVSDAIEIKERV